MRVCDEKPLEIQDYYFDSVEDFIKALANFKIFAITDKSTLKLYAKGKLEFHIHARFWRVSVFNDYRAILDVALDGLVRDQHLPRATKVSGARYHCGHGDQLVFISRVQFLKEPENCALWIRSRIWLQRFDIRERIGMDRLPLEAPLRAIPIVFGTINRKLTDTVVKMAASQSPSDII